VAKLKNLISKRIPTILGLLLLVAGLGAGLYLVGRATIVPKASAGEDPEEIKITNLTENQLTVSWTTDLDTSGFVKMGSNPSDLDMTAADDRDQLTGSVGLFTTHHVTIKELRPDTDYYFKIGSGSKEILFGDSAGRAYSIKTPSVLGTPPPSDTVYGKILKSDNSPGEGSIVYLTLPGATAVSALAKTDGNWALPLSTSRTEDLSAYVEYDRQATTITMFVQAGSAGTSQAVTVTANDAPVPNISLGQTYDFRNERPEDQLEEVVDGGELPPGADLGNGNILNVPVDDTEVEVDFDDKEKFSFGDIGSSSKTKPDESTFELEILNPEDEGEEIASTKPEIFGTSPKNVTLTITVESPTTYSDTISVDDDGLWEWTPPDNLEPGEHTVTVSYEDEQGVLQKIARNFVVKAAAAGGSDLPSFEATPAASQPGGQATPSATPSAPPRVTQPATDSGVPVAGILTPTLLMVILGLSLIGTCFYWQLKLNYE